VKEAKKMSDEIPGFGQQSGPDMKRLLLTGVLMSVLFIAFNHFVLPAKKPDEIKAPVAAAQEAKKEAGAQAGISQTVPVVSDPSVIATPETLPDLRTPFSIPVSNAFIEKDPAWPKGGYQLDTDNAGAKISQLAVYGYRDPIDLLVGNRSGLYFLKSRSGTLVTENAPYEIVQQGPREMIYQRTTPEGLRIRRRYVMTEENYVLRHEITVENTSQKKLQVDLDLVFRTDGKVEESSFLAPPQHELNFIAHQDGDLTRHGHSELLTSAVNLPGATNYIAFEQRYFLVSVLPKNPSDVQKVAASGEYADPNKAMFHANMELSLKGRELGPSESAKWEFDSYVGPKQLSLLKEVGRGLDETVNFGWFGVISRPLLWLLVQIYGFVHNFGLAIILLTLLIKLLTFPLTQKSFVSMQQMKKIGPEVKALEKKYGHDRATLSQKQMELYRERGVNPMAGCLPMFLQFPIWIALYQMLSNSVEIYQKPFAGWLIDLTQRDPYYVLPVLMGISMVVQQLMQPVQDDQKAMKYAMLITSVFFTFIMLNLPSGLSLYMLTNNILTLIQQIVIKRRFEVQNA
jgi:YidC/Oxa1 family membrane protein insertase